MANSLFRRKTIDSILTDAEKGDTDVHAHGLKRVLTVRDLTFFGIAAIIGAGSFSQLGRCSFSMVVPVLYSYLLLLVLPVHLLHFVIQNLQAVYPLQVVHILMLMHLSENYLHG